MRIMSVIGALLLAAMCLAVPASAATQAHGLAFDEVVLHLAAAPVVDAVAIADATPDAALLMLASTSAAHKADAACDGHGGIALNECLDQPFTASHTSRRYDPGWRGS